MYKKIFLTGDIHIGKSTVISKYLEIHKEIEVVSGFRTKEIIKDGSLFGYSLEDLLYHDENYTLAGINKLYPAGRKNEGVTETFETRGVEILNQALNNKCDLIILDELGFFELNAESFKQKIFEILDSDIKVLGVLKKQSNPFLDNIRVHKNVEEIEVTALNRDEIIAEIDALWR